MARRSRNLSLGVFLNSRQIGSLTQQSSGAVDFRYAAEWLGWKSNLPVSLSLPLREERYIGAPVLAVFDNLLPDHQGIRKRVAERIGAEGVDAMSLLAALGRDCVGALQFLPDGADPGPAGVIEGRAISEAEIADILRNLATNPLGIDKGKDFRISIAGVQEKTALLKRHERWRLPTGTTPTTHILKPQIGKLPNGLDLSNSVENEYLCLKLTEAFGLPSATATMESFEDRRALVVERFDRLWTADGRLLRRPQEDMCQALGVPWARKYQSEGGPGIRDIGRLLGASDEPALDRGNFLAANLVFWLLGASDGHAKNFSVFLSPGGGFHLTPLYDVISAQPSFDAKPVRHKDFRLAMAVGKSRLYQVLEIVGRHFIESGEQAGMGRSMVSAIIENAIETAPRAIRHVTASLPTDFPGKVAESIMGGIDRRVAQLTRELKTGFA